MTSERETAILLTTVNARYSHTSFGLRWLWANLGPLRDAAAIMEFNTGQRPIEMVEALLARRPRVVGVGVYIWNVDLVTQAVTALKRIRPEIVVVLGGPEVSYEYEGTALFEAADYLVRGEGEEAFKSIAEAVLDGCPPASEVHDAPHADLDALALPYSAYSDEDIAHRTLYVETSRGCPFHCEFCLSSLDSHVREFPLPPFFEAIETLIARGARRFSFVDRTFNLRYERIEPVARFFLDRWQEGMQLHFEILPDRLTERMLDLLAAFPAGGLHLETGVQTYHPPSQAAIARQQDMNRTEEALRFLRNETGAIIHADLVAGLPEETLGTFRDGFDRLLALRPHEIQVGILKRLKGAPIGRHAESGRLTFADAAPYEVLQTDWIDFLDMQRLKRFARYFDLYYNSGNFPRSLGLLWSTQPSAFDAFMGLSDWIWAATGRTHEFSLARLAELLARFLTNVRSLDPAKVAGVIEEDYESRPGRSEKLRLHGKSGQ